MYVWHLIGPMAVSFLSDSALRVQDRRSRALAVGFLLAICGWAQLIPASSQTADTIQISSVPGAPSTTGNSEKFAVSGTVTDAVTGEPIRKALVQINGQRPRTTFTDGDGRFQFEGISPGIASFIAQKPGYFGEQEMRSHTQPQVEVGPKTDSIALKLTPEGVISGKVASSTGVPLEHVPLSLTYIDVREGRRHWESKGITNTDEDGRFRFANLMPGTYYLAAGPITPQVESLFDLDQKPKTGYPSLYYPGVPDLASASPIQLSAGQQAEANFAINEVAVYSVSGTISGYAPNQGVGIQLHNQSGSPLPIEVQFSPENGRFDMHGVPAGAYVLKAFSSLGPNQPIHAGARLNVASNVSNLHLTLGPTISIPVSVRTESRASADKIPMAYVGPSNPGPPAAVRLLANEAGMGDSYSTLEGPPGQQSLQLRNVDPGKYTVEVIPQGSWYVQSAEYGQTNLLTDDLTLTATAPALPIQVVLRNDGGSLSATVHVPDRWTTPVTVVAIPEGLAKASPRVTYIYGSSNQKSDGAGTVLDSLAPGGYLVFAFDHAEGIEYSNPDVLQNYTSQAAHVTVAPNQRTKVTLELIRIGEGPQ
jgi:hypothetical protein